VVPGIKDEDEWHWHNSKLQYNKSYISNQEHGLTTQHGNHRKLVKLLK